MRAVVRFALATLGSALSTARFPEESVPDRGRDGRCTEEAIEILDEAADVFAQE